MSRASSSGSARNASWPWEEISSRYPQRTPAFAILVARAATSGAGVKAADELIALVVEISGHVEAVPSKPQPPLMERCPGVFSGAVRLAGKPVLEQLGRLVGADGQRTSQRQSFPRLFARQVVSAPPSRVKLDHLPLQMV
jgi:hypothetical protein